MILVDTSVWIDFFDGKETDQVSRFRGAIEDSEDICVCGLVMTEVLQGIKFDKEFEVVKRRLSGLIYLPITAALFIQSAALYRRIRKHGKTIRSSIDCLIASICIEHDVKLLHNDKDFDTIEAYSALRIFR